MTHFRVLLKEANLHVLHPQPLQTILVFSLFTMGANSMAFQKDDFFLAAVASHAENNVWRPVRHRLHSTCFMPLKFIKAANTCQAAQGVQLPSELSLPGHWFIHIYTEQQSKRELSHILAWKLRTRAETRGKFILWQTSADLWIIYFCTDIN